MLKIENLNAGYDDVQILRSVSLTVDEGEIVGIVGSNGAGKSTLIRSIMGLIKPMSGSINMDGVELTKIPPYKVVDSGIGLVMEGRGLFPEMTVEENLITGSISKLAKPLRKENYEEVLRLFPSLRDKTTRFAGSLSGGEQQMVAIGRGLMTAPKILILDEVSLGLAPVVVEDIYNMLAQLKQKGMSLVLVEQNVFLCLKEADRAYVLENGKIVAEGKGEELLRDPEIKNKYLGV